MENFDCKRNVAGGGNEAEALSFQPNGRPICPHNEYCGGCIYQENEYSKQLLQKGKEVLSFMKKQEVDLSNLQDEFRPEDIVPAPTVYEYRNKMEYTFGDRVKDGEMTLGMHQKGRFMSIVTVDQCQLVPEDFNIILRNTLDFCNEKGYRFYHKKTHQGLVRNLIIRRGVRTGEMIVNIVTSSQTEFDGGGYVARLKGISGKLHDNIVGILQTINDGVADAVYCDELKVLDGQDFYMEKIAGLDFKVSAFSFFQTNVPAAERLYLDAVGFIDELDGKTVFDLFCGTGTISQIIARKAKKVVGVELVEEAVAAARENAALNKIENCEFIAGDVFKVLDNLTEKPDLIVVDPPRVGILPKTIDKLVNYGVDNILYVSCNPKTMAADLKHFELYGYKPVKLKAYDNFPMTKHIEAVTLLAKER